MFTQEEIDTFVKSTFHIAIGRQSETTETNIDLIKKSWSQLSPTSKEYIKNFLSNEVDSHNKIISSPGHDDFLMTNLGDNINASRWINFLSWTNSN